MSRSSGAFAPVGGGGGGAGGPPRSSATPGLRKDGPSMVVVPPVPGAGSSAMVTPTMDVHAAVGSYVDRIVSSVPGMKALVLDDDVKRVVSMVYTQTQILEKSVFLTASLIPDTTSPKYKPREKMMHLKGVIVARPVRASVEAILAELREPMYGEYHLFFTNTLRQDSLRDLAETDRYHVVKQVQEFYADFLAVNRDLFDLDLRGYLKLTKPRGRWTRDEDDLLFRRSIQGVMAVLLSLRQKPTIRFTAGSDLCAQFARELKHEMEKDRTLFDFGAISTLGGPESALLLILDRRDDPVTPILSQWTYQAMVHELIGIRDSIVDLSNAPKVDEDMRRVVLSQHSDGFFADNMFKDYGTLAENARRLLETYKAKFDSSRQIKSVEDMQAFVEKFPEFKQLANNATKHVAIVGELSRLVEQLHLLDVSALEQDLACTNDHASHLERVRQKVLDPSILPDYKLNLVLLYALRYEAHAGNRIGELKQLLKQDVPPANLQLVDQMLTMCGGARRALDLFGTGGDFISKSIQMGIKTMSRSAGGVVDNIFTQHKPLLAKILDDAKMGRLPEAKFPNVAGAAGGAPNACAPPARDVVVFILGGATFEEAAYVASLNALNPATSAHSVSTGFRVVLGGTSLLNSLGFRAEIQGASGV